MYLRYRFARTVKTRYVEIRSFHRSTISDCFSAKSKSGVANPQTQALKALQSTGRSVGQLISCLSAT